MGGNLDFPKINKLKNREIEKSKLNKKKLELERKERLKQKAKESAIIFQREFRNSIVTAIVSAFSLLIALSWKDVIAAWVLKLSEQTPVKNSLMGALLTTFISVTGILLISKLGHDKKK